MVLGFAYSVAVYGPEIKRRHLRRFFASYRHAGDKLYAWHRFLAYVRTGRIVNCEVSRGNEVLGRFGVELCGDYKGAYVSLLYLEGVDLDSWTWEMIDTVKKMAETVTMLCEPRCYVKGRKGWPRWLKAKGIYIDDAGFVGGWQKGLQHG